VSTGFPGRDQLTRWLREHAIPLASLDPAAPLDDLEPLREVVGDARVVALGENAHFIREFSLMRHRLLRFLVERCGRSIYAFEFGFSEGFGVDAWVRGEGHDDQLERFAGPAIPWGLAGSLRWMRERNRGARRPVRFAGIDVPEAGGSLAPALDPLVEYLRAVDPDALPLLDSARTIANTFAGRSMALAAPAWARLDVADQQALTVSLTRLLIRVRALRPLYVERAGTTGYDIAVRRLEGACQTDHLFRTMADVYAGRGLPGDASARELYMAGSVMWHLEHADPDTLIVVAAHNAHIQKTAVVYNGILSALPMGQHLERMLGRDYLAIALTSTAGHTAVMRLDAAAPFGFSVGAVVLPPPEPGSIEAAFADAGLGACLADLRRAPRGERRLDAGSANGPDRFRMHDFYMPGHVFDSFDAIVNVPVSTVADDIGF
jgi:erythromycin esterase